MDRLVTPASIASTAQSFSIRAPTRIDFGGGWTDVPPYDVEQGGYVCNVAISRYATVRVEPTLDPRGEVELSVARSSDLSLLQAVAGRYRVRGARLVLSNDFPVAAGLGGSSAACVASIAAALRWAGESRSRQEIAEASREVEIVEMGIAGGRQDHYAAAFGGALGIRFGLTVTPNVIVISETTAAEIRRRCLVVYTGESRISSTTITAVMSAYRTGVPRVRNALARTRELAEEMAEAVGAGDLDALGALVGEQWRHQRSLDRAIPTPLIDSMIDTATRAGALGCKALGASGGGCVLVIAASDRVDEVRRAVAPMGTIVDYTVDTMGVIECA